MEDVGVGNWRRMRNVRPLGEGNAVFRYEFECTWWQLEHVSKESCLCERISLVLLGCVVCILC